MQAKPVPIQKGAQTGMDPTDNELCTVRSHPIVCRSPSKGSFSGRLACEATKFKVDSKTFNGTN